MDAKELQYALETEKSKVKALEFELRKREAEVQDKKMAIIRLTEELRLYKENCALAFASLDTRVKEIKEMGAEINALRDETALRGTAIDKANAELARVRAENKDVESLVSPLEREIDDYEKEIQKRDAKIALLKAVPKDSSWMVGYENGLSNKDDEWRKRVLAEKAVVDAEYAKLDSEYSIPDCPYCILYGRKKALESLLGVKNDA
jgi:chromosome segregation ATPase